MRMSVAVLFVSFLPASLPAQVKIIYDTDMTDGASAKGN
jgi:hypothetical protein